MKLDLTKLHVFYEVARTGSLAAASRRLHVTPSAVSHALRKLQSGLGHDLLRWRGRRLGLTGEGERLLQACRTAFDTLEEAERRLASDNPDRALTIGSTLEFGTSVLIAKLQPLLAAQPSLRLHFHFSDELVLPLVRDEVDLAIDCRAHTHPALQTTPLFREKYLVIAAPAFLERHPVRVPMDLRAIPVLSSDREGQWWNHALRAVPQERRPTLERIVVVNHVRGMINCVRAGYGVGLVPKYAVLDDIANGSLRPLFPRLQLPEDTFSVFQKLSRAGRPEHRLVTRHLREIDVSEFGDALPG